MALTPSTFNVQMIPVLTAHLREAREGMPIEQAYEGTRLLNYMQKDREREILGGGYIHTPVSASADPLGGEYSQGDTINTDQSEEDTTAITKLKFYSEPIKLWHTDMVEAGGEKALFNYVSNKHDQAMRRIKKKIATDLLALTTANAKKVEAIGTIVAKAPATGVIQGIDRAAAGNEFWRNKQASVGSWAANGMDTLDEQSLELDRGGEGSWDYGVCDKATLKRMKSDARTYRTIQNTPESAEGKRMTYDLGIPVIEYDGKPIFYDPYVDDEGGTDGKLYMLGKEQIQLAVVPGEEFVIRGPFPLEAVGKHGVQWHVMWAGEAVAQLPGDTCVLHGITD